MRPQEFTGSGFLISPDGRVYNSPSVEVAEEVSVKFPQSEKVHARVVSSEPLVDVALLQLERVPAGATVATLADSDNMEVGDEVFIVGAPLGLSQTMSYGHISGSAIVPGTGRITVNRSVPEPPSSVSVTRRRSTTGR